MRYGLLDLLVWTIFLGSFLASVFLPLRWEKFKELPGASRSLDAAALSLDGTLLATYENIDAIRLYSFPGLKLRWTSKPITVHSNLTELYFKSDSPEIILALLDVSAGGKYTIIRASIDAGELETREYRNVEDAPGDLSFLNTAHPQSGEYRIFAHDSYVSRARYPDGWTGHLYRPEVWVTIVAGLFLGYRVVRIRMRKRAT